MRKKRTRTKRKSNKSYNRKKTKAIKKGRAKRSKKMRGGMRGMSYEEIEEGIVKKILEEGRVLSPDPWWDEAIDTNSKFRVITKSIQDVNDAVKNGHRAIYRYLEKSESLLEARIISLEDAIQH